MSIKQETKYGYINIDDNVIKTVAGLSAIECYGIVGMAAINVADGLFKLLKRENLSRGINLIYDNEDELCQSVELELHVIVSYGTNISAIGDTLIETVKYSVESSTGITVSNVDVFVEGIRVLA